MGHTRGVRVRERAAPKMTQGVVPTPKHPTPHSEARTGAPSVRKA